MARTPNLDRRDYLAELMASGMTPHRAAKAGGFSPMHALRLSKQPEFMALVQKKIDLRKKQVAEVNTFNRIWVESRVAKIIEWCMQGVEEGEPCEKCGKKLERLFDAKNALKGLEMMGLEQGMFKRQLDVTSRKVAMIDGTQDQILDRLAQLLERLGIAAMAQLFERLGHDDVTAAMQMIGFQVSKANGRGNLQHDDAERDDGDGGDAGEADALALPALSETGGVS